MVKSCVLISFAATVAMAFNDADAAQLRAQDPDRFLAAASESGSMDGSTDGSEILLGPQIVLDDSIDIVRPVFFTAAASTADNDDDEDDEDDFLAAVDPLGTDYSENHGDWNESTWGEGVDSSAQDDERRLEAEASSSGSYDITASGDDNYEAESAFDDTSALTSGVRLWGQCGGMYYEGETECAAGTYCKFMSAWISICYPAA